MSAPLKDGYDVLKRGVSTNHPHDNFIYWAEVEVSSEDWGTVTLTITAGSSKELDEKIPRAVAEYYRSEGS